MKFTIKRILILSLSIVFLVIGVFQFGAIGKVDSFPDFLITVFGIGIPSIWVAYLLLSELIRRNQNDAKHTYHVNLFIILPMVFVMTYMGYPLFEEVRMGLQKKHLALTQVVIVIAVYSIFYFVLLFAIIKNILALTRGQHK